MDKLRLRKIYGSCLSTQQGGMSQSLVAFPGLLQSYTLEGYRGVSGLESCTTG